MRRILPLSVAASGLQCTAVDFLSPDTDCEHAERVKMHDTDVILGFVRSCTYGNLGLSECSPVFVFGGIALAMGILVIVLAVLIISRTKSQPARQDHG